MIWSVAEFRNLELVKKKERRQGSLARIVWTPGRIQAPLRTLLWHLRGKVNRKESYDDSIFSQQAPVHIVLRGRGFLTHGLPEPLSLGRTPPTTFTMASSTAASRSEFLGLKIG